MSGFKREVRFAVALGIVLGSTLGPVDIYRAAEADKTSQPSSETKERSGAFGGTLDGRVLYEKACASCHDNGFNGAPRLIESDWPYYEELGAEHYTYNAIEGIGIMPPRGGQPELTDLQVRRAVEYMLEQLDNP